MQNHLPGTGARRQINALMGLVILFGYGNLVSTVCYGANKNVDDTVQLDPTAFRELARELQAGRFGALNFNYTEDNEEFMVSDASTYSMNVVFTDPAGKESSKKISIYGMDSSPPLLRKVAKKMEKLYTKEILDIWQ